METSINSQVNWLLSLPESDRQKTIESLSLSARYALWDYLKDWSRHARPSQVAPSGKWFYWVIKAGRGWGKTRTAMEYIRSKIDSGEWRTVNAAGPTWMDVKDTMVYGSAAAPGLMGVWPPHQAPELKLSSDNPHLICHNGAMIRLRAAKEAERFRGPQADGGWAEEVDAWSPNRMPPREAFTLFELGIRLGSDPRIVVTSTPKPGRIVAMLKKRRKTHITNGATRDNYENLAESFIEQMEELYGGTRIGRQELEGELLEDVPGALVTRDAIEENKTMGALAPSLSDYERIVIGVDPAGGGGDEKGITAWARLDGHAYGLADRSSQGPPEEWGATVVNLYHDLSADCVVAEKNYGGDMVESVIVNAARIMGVNIPRVKLVHASRGKHIRFEPVGMLYQQGRVHHCFNSQKLEDQVCSFNEEGYQGEDDSPDRADSAVFAITDLMPRNKGLTPKDLYRRAA